MTETCAAGKKDFLSTLRNYFKFDRNSPWYFYRKVLLWSFVLATAITLPFVILEWVKTGSGVFLYYGDYNAQQICFYEHCVEMVHNGDFGWDWVTDLGSNFVGSYSYYMLGSPFFWVMCLFPASWAPYLMAPMYIIKYMVAAVVAYAYLQRFVKNKNYAVIGGLLYAFCGFQIYNTFFNQFHDVVAFFPLLLIGIEEFVVHNRKGLFAVAVLVNALINYFMFAGQVAFCVIYFIARVSCKSFRMHLTVGKFFGLALEALLGFVMAWFLFLPAASALMGNDRISNSYIETIKDMFKALKEGKGETAFKLFKRLFVWEQSGELYWQRYGQIFESYFFPPDIPSRVNFFSGHGTRWASISMYMPLFSFSGVFALFTVKKRTWLKGLIVFLVVCSFVPILNSMFFLFNSSYYARWLYMMMLMTSLATIVALEDIKTNWQMPSFINTAICAIVAIALGLIWNENASNNKTTLGYPPYINRFWIYVGLAFLGIIATGFIIKKYRGTKQFDSAILIGVSVMTVLYGCIHISDGKKYSENSNFMVDQIIEGTVELPDPKDGFYRIDQFKTSKTSTIDNLGIYWNYPTMECFHTVVPPSIMNFYPNFDITRSVGSRAESKYYGLRAFMSAKYSLIETRKNKVVDYKVKLDPETGVTSKIDVKTHDEETKGFEYIGSQNGYDIYENQNYIGMGFAYTQFMTESDFEKAYRTKADRHLLICKYLIVPDKDAGYYSQFMERVLSNDAVDATDKAFTDSVAERRLMTCDSFEYSSYGFDAEITLDNPNLVVFSVPYEKDGWTAKVNGKAVPVKNVTYGFMAVECQEGYNKIEFDYSTPGFATGCTITLGETDFKMPAGLFWSLDAALLFAFYMLYFKVYKKHRAKVKFFSFDYYDDCGNYAPTVLEAVSSEAVNELEQEELIQEQIVQEDSENNE
ncbi:MAG: YfhO family protein [Clostridia bacterium]|nr:YfhO family protein [Clostridia bacterium]